MLGSHPAACPRPSVSDICLFPQMKFRNGGSDMLIKIVQNGIESEWFQLTKKAHRELIKTKPEAAIVHIETC